MPKTYFHTFQFILRVLRKDVVIGLDLEFISVTRKTGWLKIGMQCWMLHIEKRFMSDLKISFKFFFLQLTVSFKMKLKTFISNHDAAQGSIQKSVSSKNGPWHAPVSVPTTPTRQLPHVDVRFHIPPQRRLKKVKTDVERPFHNVFKFFGTIFLALM